MELQRPPARRNPSTPAARRRPGQLGTVVVLIVSLLLAGLFRTLADNRQAAFSRVPGTPQGRSTLGNMNSFALALLLGGLRGPLVMFLWSSSESQKADRDLEDFDTKVEWIRLLQPEFDSVHIFQIWNKAYNISAMMASPANKYSVIIEALEYGQNVDAERPGDVNILQAIGNVYSGKLGSTNLPEFAFYTRQFRAESMTDANCKRVYGRVPRLDRWKPFLDDNNEIRADLLKPTRGRPADLAADAEWNDGSDLQYLKKYGPFPYGISPLAMAFNYAKRTEVAVSAEGQKPLQMSDMVVDSRPGIQLKFWMEDDSRTAMNDEARAFGVAMNTDAADGVLPGESPKDPQAVQAAIHFFQAASQECRDGVAEYERHLHKPEFTMRLSTYSSHIDELKSMALMNSADSDYLMAGQISDRAKRDAALAGARDEYARAQLLLERLVLDYFAEDRILLDKGAGVAAASVLPAKYPKKADLAAMPDALVPQVYDRAMLAAVRLNSSDNLQERSDYDRQVRRCRTRIGLIASELGK